MPGPATILILAKKKAAGPEGYFDPMGSEAPMGVGPMMFEMSEDSTEEEPKMASMEPSMSKSLADMDFRAAAAKLRKIAEELEASVEKHAAQAKTLRSVVGDGEAEGEEEEDVEDEPTPAKAMAAPPKKGPPAFLKPKPMKY